MLEEAITKISTLLILGFGEAGSTIVSQSLSQFGELDPMIPGKKVTAIFGFCDILQFNNVTAALEERIMLFVNEVAKIVHGNAIEYLGVPNKS